MASDELLRRFLETLDEPNLDRFSLIQKPEFGELNNGQPGANGTGVVSPAGGTRQIGPPGTPRA